jgi:hypothetical protein
MNPQEFLNRFKHLSFTLPTIDPTTGARKTVKIPEVIGNYLNDLQSGQFNHTQYKDRPYMGTIPEVKERTERIKNNPFELLLNTDANYMNMGN